MYQFQIGLKQCFFFVNTKYIRKYNVSLNNTVTKLGTILTKCFFPYLNLQAALNAASSIILMRLLWLFSKI